MSFKEFITQQMATIFRDPDDLFRQKVSDEELSALEIGVEHELIREHLKSISGPYELDGKWSVTDPKFRALRNQSVLQYHSTFHRSLWKYLSEMSLSERRVVSDYLEIVAGNLSHGGQWLGEHQIRELARHLKESEINTGLLGEPWMSPIKARRADVRGLFEQLSEQAKIVAEELDVDVAPSECDDCLEVGELRAFDRLREKLQSVAVVRLDTRLVSLVRNMDYVLACHGDWKACHRMAANVADIFINSPFLSSNDALADRQANKAFMDNEVCYIAQAWLEISKFECDYALSAEDADSFTLRDKTVDLRMPGVIRSANMLDFGDLFKDACEGGISFCDFAGLYQKGWDSDVFGYMKKSLTHEKVGDEKDEISHEKIMQAVSRLDEMARVFFHRERELDEQQRDLRDLNDETAGERAVDYFQQYLKRWGLYNPKEIALVESLLEMISKYTDEKSPSSIEMREMVRKLCRIVEERIEGSGFCLEADDEQLSLTVLDGIGPSETKEENNPERVYRQLLSPLPLSAPKMGADELFQMLQSEFPWMIEANKQVAMACAKASHYRTGFWRLRPTVLVGPAGVGKTRWVRRLSEILGVEQYSISMSGVVQSKGVIGSERGWMSARPSFPALAFLKTKIGNPILYIDELDKLGDTDVADAFLPMLEKETSARYPDMYLLGNMNLSAATFLFSANDLGKISTILLSRLNVVHVRRPTAAEVERLLPTMFLDAVGSNHISLDEARESVSVFRRDAARIFDNSGDLRSVQSFIERRLEEQIWKPPGPKLVD